MSQSPLAGLLLLVSAHAAAAEHYHVRSPTYACVQSRAALALGRHARRHQAMHSEDRCFRVQPSETWEPIAHPSRTLLLLRKQPPQPGEPPLYFRSSSVTRAAPPRQHGRRWHHPLPSAREPSPGREAATQGAAGAHAVDRGSAALRARVPAVLIPPPAPPSARPAPPPAALVPAAPAVTPLPAAAPTAGIAAREAGPVPAARPPAVPPGRVHWVGPLLLWIAVVTMAMLLVRLAGRRRRRAEANGPEMPEPAGAPPDWRGFQPPRPRPADAAAVPGISAGEYKSRCVASLRHAGWDARTRFSANMPGPHVIASHGGLVMALQCHPSAEPVDIGAVEDACLVRERQCSDLAAVVSNAPFTEPARALAARTGIVLLHEDQLASLAV